MSILKDVAAELWSMFVADARLTLALLALVAGTGGAIRLAGLPLPYAGVVLALGTAIILLLAIALAAGFARSRHPQDGPS